MIKPWKQRAVRMQSAVGIDISDGSLELAKIIFENGIPRLTNHSRIELPAATIVNGILIDESTVFHAIRELCAAGHIDPHGQPVLTALPDQQVVVRIIEIADLAQHSYEELADRAREASIPASRGITSPVMQWHAWRTNGKRGALAIFTTSRLYIEQWRAFFEQHHMRLESVEMESLALARAVLPSVPAGHRIALLDMGYRATALAVFEGSGLVFSLVIPGGMASINAARATNHATSTEQIQHRHDHYTGADGELIQRILVQQLTAARTALVDNNCVPQKLYLTGGGSLLPEAAQRIASIMSVPTVAARLTPSSGGYAMHTVHAQLTPSEQHLYAGAIGIALKGRDPHTSQTGINFLNAE